MSVRSAKGNWMGEDAAMTVGEEMIRERIDEVRRIAAKTIIRDFPGVPYERDDLIQDAIVRLLIDARNYDPSKGRFSTFVSALTRVSVLNRLQADRCKSRRPEQGIRSLDEVIWTNSHRYGTEIRLMDRIADPTDYEERCTRRMSFEDALAAVDTLKDERMKKIIRGRYLGDEKKMLGQLARELGITKERVRQLETAALQQIRKELAKKGYGLQRVQQAQTAR